MSKYRRTLLDIAEDFITLDEILDDLDGDISGQEAAVAALFAENDRDLSEKVEGYVKLIREHEARAKIRKQEEERIAELRKTDENRAKWLKDRLLYALKAMDVDRVDTATSRVTIAKNGGKLPLIVDDEVALLDAGYKVTTIEVDKKKTRKALEDGETVIGARLGERGESLRIK